MAVDPALADHQRLGHWGVDATSPRPVRHEVGGVAVGPYGGLVQVVGSRGNTSSIPGGTDPSRDQAPSGVPGETEGGFTPPSVTLLGTRPLWIRLIIEVPMLKRIKYDDPRDTTT